MSGPHRSGGCSTSTGSTGRRTRCGAGFAPMMRSDASWPAATTPAPWRSREMTGRSIRRLQFTRLDDGITGRHRATARPPARRDHPRLHRAEPPSFRRGGHRCAGGAGGCRRYRATTERVPLMRAIALPRARGYPGRGLLQVQPLAEVSASLTTLPMPSGAADVASASGAAVESCDATASLRPSTAAGPDVEEIRQPRPADRRSGPEHQPVQLSRSGVRRIAGLRRRHRPGDSSGPGRRSRAKWSSGC